MAKIKNRVSENHHTKPRGTNRRAFERVYWPYIPIVLAVSFLLVAGFSSGNLAAYVRHPTGRVLSYSTSMSISGLLADTNSARASNGIGNLKLNNKLNAAAQAKADDMAAKNYWSHYTPSGDAPWVFVANENYSYQKLGENLATGFDNEQSTINGWMASAPHKQNVLDPSFKDVGFGFANNPNYTSAGGGPMTIVVAFYGQSSVHSAATNNAAAPTNQSHKQTTAVTISPKETNKAPSSEHLNKDVTEPSKQTTAVQIPSQNTAPEVKPSRIQLAVPNSHIPQLVTTASILAALAIFALLFSSHLRAFRRYLLRGERYLVRHPLTDISMVSLAALLFILSQTAGIVK